MRKQVFYTYLGTNGTIVSPVHLEDIYYTRKIKLMADPKHQLINSQTGRKTSEVLVPEDEVEFWSEIEE